MDIITISGKVATTITDIGDGYVFTLETGYLSKDGADYRKYYDIFCKGYMAQKAEKFASKLHQTLVVMGIFSGVNEETGAYVVNNTFTLEPVFGAPNQQGGGQKKFYGKKSYQQPEQDPATVRPKKTVVPKGTPKYNQAVNHPAVQAAQKALPGSKVAAVYDTSEEPDNSFEYGYNAEGQPEAQEVDE
jgi:hypothetical protein